MSNFDLEELKLSKWQFFLTVSFILLLFVSLSLTYNQILKFKKERPIYNKKEELNVLKTYRVIGLLIAVGYLFIDIFDKQIKEKYNKKTSGDNLEITAGVLTVAATIITLYLAFIGDDSTENPDV